MGVFPERAATAPVATAATANRVWTYWPHRRRGGHHQDRRQQCRIRVLAVPHPCQGGDHGHLHQCRRPQSYGHGDGKARVGYRRSGQRRLEGHHLCAARELLLHLYATPLDVWASHCGVTHGNHGWPASGPAWLLDLVAQLISVCSAYNLAEARYISSPVQDASPAKTSASSRSSHAHGPLSDLLQTARN